MWEHLGAKFTGQQRVALWKDLLLALVKYLNERALTVLGKGLNTVADESEDETKEIGSQAVE